MEITKAIHDLPSQLQPVVAQYWVDFQQALEDKQLVLKVDSFFLSTVAKVWACSDFVATTCIHYPEMVQDLLASGGLEKHVSPSDFRQQYDALGSEFCHDEILFAKQLRLFRNQQMLRIAWRDLSGLSSLHDTSGELSHLADFCLERGLAILSRIMYEKFGYPLDKKGQVQQLLIAALGKLGGSDLNFSSDIDLIFIYPTQGETQNGPRSLTHDVFFTRLAQGLVRLLSECNQDGFVFRVDMRLRPFGEMGPLVHSYCSVENYYQEQGRDWERYALLKARLISQDGAFKKKVETLFKRFVYRRYLDYGIIDALRDLKKMMDNERRRKRLKNNVKRGSGGIREIEFIIQSLQLVRGGKETLLQTNDFYQAIDLLSQSQYLTQVLASQLRDSYTFFRILENRLQMLEDKQTQQLPTSDRQQQQILLSMGYGAWDEFVVVIQEKSQPVENYYTVLGSSPIAIEGGKDSTTGQDDDVSYYQNIWLKKIDASVAQRFLARQGVVNEMEFIHLLEQFSLSYGLTKMSSRARKRLDRLMPVIISKLTSEDNGTICLARMIPILEAISRRSAYLALLLENPGAIDYLVELCSQSSWLAKEISRYPILLDELLDRRIAAVMTFDELEQELRQLLLLVPEDDLEHQMEVLRQFKHSLLLRTANFSLSSAKNNQLVSRQLSDIGAVIVAEVVKLAWKNLVQRHGYPVSEDNPGGQMKFAVLAYGSFGAYDLSYLSDLDLVFLHDAQTDPMTNGRRPLSHQQFYLKLAQKVIHLLSTRTLSGTLYDLDLRLRPSGSAGLLVSSFSAFAEYQMEHAWIWEHQALTKGRFITGDGAIKEQFHQLRKQALCRPREEKDLKNQIIDMRSKMRQNAQKVPGEKFDVKLSPGGLTDIEFMVQYWILRWAKEYPEFIANYEMGKILALIAGSGIVPEPCVRGLLSAHQKYKDLIHQAALQEQPAIFEASEFAEHSDVVMDVWNRVFL